MSTLPNAPFLAGPEPYCAPRKEPAPRDFRDALTDARLMAKDASHLYRDDPAIERAARLEYIEAAFSFLIEARTLLGESQS